MSSVLAAEGGFQPFDLHGGEWFILIGSALTALLALGVGFFLMKGVLAYDEGTPKMIEIAKAIQEGAQAYLRRQFKTIAVILVPLAIVVFITSTAIKKESGVEALSYAQSGIWRTLAFVLGCFMSGLTGFIGMSLAVRGNVRTAAAAKAGSMPKALQVAFRTGGVCGHVHRRSRSARRDGHHHDLPEHELGDPRRLRVRRLVDRAVPPRRRRHLHQGGRRRCRPRRQGRSRDPRRRPAQPRDDRRQRRRQRRRLRRYGVRPVRVLRGDAGRIDHPRRSRVPGHLPEPARALGGRCVVPARCPRARRHRVDHRRVLGARHREGQVRDGADQPRLPRRRDRSRSC